MSGKGYRPPPLGTPIYRHVLHSTAWQLLWWMICAMDDNQEVLHGWRTRAARALNRDRAWVGACGQQLAAHGFIESEPRQRRAKVLVKNISG